MGRGIGCIYYSNSVDPQFNGLTLQVKTIDAELIIVKGSSQGRSYRNLAVTGSSELD